MGLIRDDDGPGKDRFCECSRDWLDDDKHKVFHEEWLNGLTLDDDIMPMVVNGLLSVSMNSPENQIRFVHRLAGIPKKEFFYDRAVWPPFQLTGEGSDMRAYLTIRDRKAVALCVTMDAGQWGAWPIDSRETVASQDVPLRRGIFQLWVCGRLRGEESIAMTLLTRTAAVEDYPTHELAWVTPLWDLEYKMACHFSRDGTIFLC